MDLHSFYNDQKETFSLMNLYNDGFSFKKKKKYIGSQHLEVLIRARRIEEFPGSNPII